MAAPLSKLRPTALLLTIRFSSSLPDLTLDIPTPASTTIVALKNLIRTQLEPPYNANRLRLIYQGKILLDSAALSALLPPTPPTPRSSTTTAVHQDVAAKGKGKDVAGQADEEQQRVYVICSIGDELSVEELASEVEAAQIPVAATSLKPAAPNIPATGAARPSTPNSHHPPRGFDRLLAAGFTQAEVSQLRLQFTDIQAQRHTPDTMPSPDSMRNMEDLWMDANGGNAVPGGGGVTATTAAGEEPVAHDSLGSMHEQLDGLVKGMLMGFFWPLGGLAWLTREDGMLSQRWRVWIGFGVSFSAFVGLMRALFGGEQ
ncbi:hypothetical protein BN1723_011930, partial [Verticillium longisporum]